MASSDRHYYPDDLDVEQQQRLVGGDDESLDDSMDDSRTPLDKTIDRIGMGSYQWALLSLCGFGWMADNMWIQAIAIILPRVQQHYDVSDSVIGSLSSSMFAGMMIGAVGWGTCSDLLGRSAAFNATLFFTAVFGFCASWANTFGTLCVALFFLGSAVGGSMPTDGTLLLEHMPKEKQYLVTALSVFFSFGSVLSAFVALIVLPGNSCPNAVSGPISGHSVSTSISSRSLHLLDALIPGCDVETQNKGWKYLLMTLASITLSMFLARIVFFRLHESPRYLVHAGRPHEAVKSLQMISKFNGSDLEIELDDVADHHPDPSSPTSANPTGAATGASSNSTSAPSAGATPLDIQNERRRVDERTVFDAGDVDGSGSGSTGSSPTRKTSSESANGRAPLVTQYDSIGQTQTNVLEGKHSFKTPVVGDVDAVYPPTPQVSLTASSETVTNSRQPSHTDDDDKDKEENEGDKDDPFLDAPPRPRFSRHPTTATNGTSASRLSTATFRSSASVRRQSMGSRRSSVYEYERKCRVLPKSIRKPLAVWWDRVSMVLEPEWFRTTVLVWAVWFSMSLAFTMFNVYFPKLLELAGNNAQAGINQVKTLEENLWDVMIFTLGGTPGAILGAWLIESSLGRRWSLALSTFTTAAFCIVFIGVEATWAVRTSTVGISLSATAMWAVLYGWTPEIFGTKVRGSACGIASALSRIGGMIAPLLGGTLLMISRAVPVYTAVVVFALAGFCVLLLKEDEGDKSSRGKGRAVLH